MESIFLDDIFMNEDEMSMGEWMKLKGYKGLKHCQVPSQKMMIHWK